MSTMSKLLWLPTLFLPKSTVQTHKGELTGLALAVHPTNSIFALLTTFNQILRLAPSDIAFTSLAIHPDGTLLALGAHTSTIQILKWL